MWNKLTDWYLALIGIIVIAGGPYIARHTPDPPMVARKN
jgi:hypothetical protein